MSAQLLIYLVMKSAGAGIGVFLGTFVGFVIRARKGKTDGMIRGSATLTALAAGGAALLIMMVVNYVRLPG
ncbi:hypothetical protein FIU97_08310 [Roseivivax sp. THAF40]|uniref:hypothetical protein n=1 Tax=unclassified Roseivivax TaxID=2639302 RepID=UPI0012AA1C2C|nr:MULTISPECIES: hypothetical protein [unclassified Roseivivax]QFS82801.1 hypothetical protein FIV09_08205 [Roseivivax sp. THAF197b]QFT46570.1 hypothetical protein FIU97_08310 [Roseivivax sp. THAF40]